MGNCQWLSNCAELATSGSVNAEKRSSTNALIRPTAPARQLKKCPVLLSANPRDSTSYPEKNRSISIQSRRYSNDGFRRVLNFLDRGSYTRLLADMESLISP